MGNILILYHSNTGNTANMAKYVAEGVQSVQNTEMRFNLKTVTHLNHVHVYPWIFVIKDGIGHMLQSIANGEMPIKIKIKPNVRGKRKRSAEIFIAKLVLADDGGVDAHGYIYFLVKPGKINAWTD